MYSRLIETAIGVGEAATVRDLKVDPLRLKHSQLHVQNNHVHGMALYSPQLEKISLQKKTDYQIKLEINKYDEPIVRAFEIRPKRTGVSNP